MKRKLITSLILALILVFTAIPVAALSDSITVEEPVKNVIVLIPDGMPLDAVTLARWMQDGEPLAMDEIASGMMRTYSADAPVADSAPAATAMATGFKSHTGFVGVLADENTMPGQEPLAEKDVRRPVATVLEAAKLMGKATGLISTSEIMHATPAGFSAHVPDRKNYDWISEQQVHQGIDVVLGSGRNFFSADHREDSKDMIAVIEENYQYVTTPAEMAEVTEGKIFGLFGDTALAYDMDRDPELEPSISEMTEKAIALLSQNENGFFLMVEGSKIDWAAHANDPIGLISDVLAFDATVKVALDFAKEEGNTLVIAATDHANSGITIGSKDTSYDYDKRTLSEFLDALKKATLTGEGLALHLDEERSNIEEVVAEYFGIEDLTEEEIELIKETDITAMNYAVGPMIASRALIGFTTNGHTGGDVTLYCYAPENLTRLTGVIDNTDMAAYVELAMGANLAEVTDRLFVRAAEALEAKGGSAEFDEAEGTIILKNGDKEVTISVNTNLAVMGDETILLPGVAVYSGDQIYVSQEALDLLD